VNFYAEKVRALTKRKRARDLYDINYLLSKNVKLDKKLVEEKLKYYDEEIDLRIIEKSIEDIKNYWIEEMKILTRSTPEYSEVASFVLKKLRDGLS